MDKNDAIEIGKLYVNKVQKNNIPILEAWLFGSYAKGTFGKDSDIDIALVLPDNNVSFSTEVRLMTLRHGEETMIEPHLYGKKDFQANTPMTEQIRQYGIPINV
ncbi:MAG: nucleotidyltransferase domain-containing protein [Bacteroidales bacterium]|jgi:predicted nucleotidyltransferase|nr:nucleotidyltransferase domain-containing protein [Bacteroidales bacterium]